MNLDLLLVYGLPLVAIWLLFHLRRRIRSRTAADLLAENREAGLVEPPSLHPLIDPAICLGCTSCVRACPEGTVLGVIDGKAHLVEPTMCVGHGACQSACPTGAITLVFGTETRGVDIPVLTPEFETSVSGIFIAGELGGMGLIKNAIEQGRQAIGHAADHARGIADEAGVLDVVIIGCGPAGIAASLGAIERKLRFVTIDQSTLGGTVAHFPRGKLVMTAPATLPLVGKVRFAEVGKEELLSFWEDVIANAGLEPRFEEGVTAVERQGETFCVTTTRQTFRAKAVLLAIGRRGTPRQLDVPGEGLGKVVYRLIDPEQYRGRRILVVGGGDSALEAALRLADQPGTTVSLSYRGAAFSRARARNRNAVAEMAVAGRIDLALQSRVHCIEDTSVTIECEGELRKIPNDDVIICAGGLLPTQFLHGMGINLETKFGTV